MHKLLATNMQGTKCTYAVAPPGAHTGSRHRETNSISENEVSLAPVCCELCALLVVPVIWFM